MAIVSPSPNLIQEQDVTFSTSVSEAVGFKLGGSLNHVLTNFYTYTLGFGGGFHSALTTPYASLATEVVRVNSVISDIYITQQLGGSSGVTQFYIQKQPAGGGPFVTIFSVDGQISSSAGNDVKFYSSSGGTPTGVTKPVFPSASLLAGETIQLVLFTSAVQARNLQLQVITRPV